jgi:hypothetical protein
MLEKDKKVIGGTTSKSGGIFWIPNNPLMQKEGLVDEKEDWLAYAARKSYEHKFDKSKPQYGLSDREYDWLSTYYDAGPEMVQGLVDTGVAANLTNMVEMKDGTVMQDYGFCHLEYDNKAPVGRMLGIGSEPNIKGLIHTLTGWMNSAEGMIKAGAGYIPGLRELRLLRMFGCDVSQVQYTIHHTPYSYCRLPGRWCGDGRAVPEDSERERCSAQARCCRRGTPHQRQRRRGRGTTGERREPSCYQGGDLRQWRVLAEPGDAQKTPAAPGKNPTAL